MEQQSLLRAGCTISISESVESGLFVADLNPEASIYPQEHYTTSISDDHCLHVINNNEAENTQTERRVAVMVLDLIQEEGDKEKESGNADSEVDWEKTGSVGEMSDYPHHSPPSVGGQESLMISPASWSQVSAECFHHTDNSLFPAEASDSPGVIDNLQTDMDVVREKAAPTTQSSSVSDIITDPESHTHYATSINHESDSSPVDNDYLIPEMNDVLCEGSRAENDTSSVRSHLDGQTLSIDYSSQRDLAESVIMSEFSGNCSYDNNITEDGSRMTLPQRAALCSERDFSVGSEPSCSENDQRSSQLHVVSDELTSTKAVNLKCFNVEDSDHYTLTTDRVSLETALVDEDMSQHIPAEDDELGTTRFSPERQHEDLFTSDTKEISVSRNEQTESDYENVDIGGNESVSEMNSGQSKSIISVLLESDIPEIDRLDVFASQLHVVSDELTSTNSINLKCFNVEDSDHYTLTTDRVSLETPLVDEDMSQDGTAEDDELGTQLFSPERQHEDLFTSDTKEISVSRNAQTESDYENVDIGGSVLLEYDIPEVDRLDVLASERPQVDTDFLSESHVTSDASSSTPSGFQAESVDDKGDIVTKGTDVSDLQKAQTQDDENIVTKAQTTPPPLDESVCHERDSPHGLIESSHPDLLMDLLKQNALSLNNKEVENSELIMQKEKVGEKTENPSDAPNIQMQLLQVLRTVSTSQDLSMLQEVMDTLNSALGGDTLGGDSQEERRHTLESIKEESSEGEEEESADETRVSTSDASKVEEIKKKHSSTVFFSDQLFSVQDYLECVGRLQDHADVLEDVRKDLSIQPPVGNNLEDLQIQMEDFQSLKSQFSRLAGVITADLEKAKQLLNSVDEDIPLQIHQDLASTYLDLEPNFTAVTQMSAEMSYSLTQAMETGKVHLESTYQKHISCLGELAGFIKNNSEKCDMDSKTCDVDTLKHLIQQNKDTESSLLKEVRLKLEDVTFDIQCFISEHTQFLSPTQSSHLLKFLSSTQRSFRDQTDRLGTQRSALNVLLDTRERESQEKSLLEKQKEFAEKLEEVCDNLTLTENQLIGHRQQAENTECVTDLQQYQQEHQALQKEVLTNASALNEVITSTKTFLEENRSKLTPDQIASIESKLEEAKSKDKLINQRAEESRKDLEKVVTTAIKQESEKVRVQSVKNTFRMRILIIITAAAVERLEESKNKIEGLLDWISNIGNENESILNKDDHISKENGNLPEETSATKLIAEDDDANGNVSQTTENDSGRETSGKSDASLDLDKQYDRARHQEILSQQQDLIMATQSAQALLDKQANVLSSEEKEKLQKNIQELKGRYDASLTQAEQQMKQVQCVQEEQKKFQGDVEEFVSWLDQAEADIEKLGAPAASLNILNDKLQRQKSFSEDVISHKGDLRFITMSGQKVLDVANACRFDDSAAKHALLDVDTSGTCSACNQLGNNLKDALQGQMTGHQTAVDTLRKAAESLITSEGDLLSNSDEIQETVDDIVERYDNLSKSVSDRNEKLQITLTRSMSVQDGLDEMMGWMEGVEASVKEKGQIPLDSASIGDILSKEAALEQDIASRQSSISAMKAKVKTFVETADPSAAALLQSKMDTLSQRFTDACDKHMQKVSQLEQLKEKVEQFEEVSEKVHQFVVKRSQDLHETDGPGKTFNELSQLTQTLCKELSEISPDGSNAQIQSKMDNLSNIFNTFKDTVKEKEEEVSSCQDQLGEFRSSASVLTKWLEQTNEKVPAVQPTSSVKSLEKDLQLVTGLLDEWTSKDPAVQDLNSKGSALCSLMSLLTSPAKTKTPNKSELMVIQQNMSFVNDGYASLGVTLKSRAADLSSSVQEVKEAKEETDNMMTWLKDMKKTAASWNKAATEKDSVRTQLEQQKAFEEGMKQKQEQFQKLRETLLNLIKAHPNSPEAAKWKQMLAEIDAAWADISGTVEDRKQHLEQSNKNLDIFQTTQLQLGQWLSEKELMMSVLGPLSIDPNMLKMQKQQVQILQNEFKSRKPQYEKLEEAASSILSISGNQDPSGGKLVREQLSAVTQKWQGITGQLDQRDSLIDQAAVKTGQFQDLLRSVGQTATQLENQLTNHQGHSTQPDAVKKQLEDVHNISAQLREERRS
ncbi:hypothetical protein F7725_024139 [Dissostichus mawsoni]|uniref:Dystonin n=1 Tax=Dissostichus mawsoni TaxID=36200 RepID=A0A7J5Y1F0_DISMA|nr:hypothetical protein F7725_024139 [Dissostichus mawsoni]